jgi:PAS domain S-box-containing protein
MTIGNRGEAESALAETGKPSASLGDAAKALRWGFIVLAAITIVAAASAAFAVRQKEAQFLAGEEKRIGILASGRAEVVSTWLKGQVALSGRVVQSDTFRLFAAEAAFAEGDLSVSPPASAPAGQPDAETPPQPAPLYARTAYLSKILSEFVEINNLVSAHLINLNGESYVTSALTESLTPEQRAMANTVRSEKAAAFGPARAGATGMLLDYFAPVFPPQTEAADGQVVGVFLFTLPLTRQLSKFVEASALAGPGENFRLVQKTATGSEELLSGATEPMRIDGSPLEFGPDNALPFALRPTLGRSLMVYSVGVKVDGVDWWVLLESDAQTARAEVRSYTVAVSGLALLAVATLAAAFGAFWWRLTSAHNSALAEQFRRLAARIDSQRRLLDGINNTIADSIGLKSLSGLYTYVNPAFAKAVGRPVEQMIGQDDQAIFGHATAGMLRISDQQALKFGEAITTAEQIYLQSELHHLQISKVPLRQADGAVTGIVSVARDITDLIEAQERHNKAIRQTVEALVRAIELRDPYLSGHSKRLAGFSGAVARHMGCTEGEVETVVIAAQLSQTGKLSIDRSLLAKAERHNDEEIVQMQQHIKHAAFILRDFDFGFPVQATVSQMYERLDGTGYPLNLNGDAIATTSRILGACDVFCARIAPRSYRSAITAREALRILTDHPGRYDGAVVAALTAVVESKDGEKLLGSVTAA